MYTEYKKFLHQMLEKNQALVSWMDSCVQIEASQESKEWKLSMKVGEETTCFSRKTLRWQEKGPYLSSDLEKAVYLSQTIPAIQKYTYFRIG